MTAGLYFDPLRGFGAAVSWRGRPGCACRRDACTFDGSRVRMGFVEDIVSPHPFQRQEALIGSCLSTPISGWPWTFELDTPRRAEDDQKRNGLFLCDLDVCGVPCFRAEAASCTEPGRSLGQGVRFFDSILVSRQIGLYQRGASGLRAAGSGRVSRAGGKRDVGPGVHREHRPLLGGHCTSRWWTWCCPAMRGSTS